MRAASCEISASIRRGWCGWQSCRRAGRAPAREILRRLDVGSEPEFAGRSGVIEVEAVPPHSAIKCCLPFSLTGISVEMVPGVCPGVRNNVGTVSPSVSFMPSVTTMSRLGSGWIAALEDDGRRHENLALGVLQEFRPARVVEVAVADDDVSDLRRIETDLLQPADDILDGTKTYDDDDPI